MTNGYSFAFRRAWLVGHVIALVAVVLFVSLGLWQLRRHNERQTLDASIGARTTAPAITVDEAIEVPIEQLEFRTVTASGCFDVDAEVVLQARSLNGRSGHNVVTPLVLADGTSVLVNRGWVPIDIEGPPVVGAAPAPCPNVVTGVVRSTEVRGGFGPVDPPTGVLERVSRVDVDRLQQQLPYELAPFYLQAIDRAAEGFPLALPAPVPGGGPPHLSYAVQWFAFAGVVTVGYPILLRSTARKSRQD